MYNGSFHAFPPGKDKDDLINSLNLKKEKYTTPPTEKQGSFSLFTSNKISPTSGSKKLLTYKLLNCSIKCSKQLFTGTSISDVIHSIANYLLPNIKTLVVSKLTILNLHTNKTYTYNLLYKAKTIHNTTKRSLNYNTLAIVNIRTSKPLNLKLTPRQRILYFSRVQRQKNKIRDKNYLSPSTRKFLVVINGTNRTIRFRSLQVARSQTKSINKSIN